MTSLPEILQSLDDARVRYVLIGGYASVIHGVPRTTVDMDLALDPEEGNVQCTLEALRRLGLQPETDRTDEILGQGGVTATNDRKVDLLTSLPGASFEEVWAGRIHVRYEEVTIPVISRQDQVRILRSSGRPQDLEDADILESLESNG